MNKKILAGVVAFARRTWRRDGAEGDTVHALCDAVEAAGLATVPHYPSDEREQGYVEGRRWALTGMADYFARELGEGAHAEFLRWYSERQQLVSALRRVCGRHGDNEWSDDLDLVDVVEKHLERYLNTTERRSG